MHRKLLAHILLGLESFVVYEFVRKYPGIICALEHDGFISYCLIDGDWQYPFLRVVLKKMNNTM